MSRSRCHISLPSIIGLRGALTEWRKTSLDYASTSESRNGGGPYSAFSLQNAWQLYPDSDAAQHRLLTLVEFRRDVAKTYISKYRMTTNHTCSICRRATLCRIVYFRFDGQRHYTAHTDGGQKRCVQCGTKVQTKCSKCSM